MNDQLLADSREHPLAFALTGPIPPPVVRAWVAIQDGVVPAELVSLWEEAGGGEIFESETILEPLPGDEGIDVRNVWLHSSGLAPTLTAFHEGVRTSAFETRTGEIVELDRIGFAVLNRYPTLDQWYRLAIRNEFWERYGLAGDIT